MLLSAKLPLALVLASSLSVLAIRPTRDHRLVRRSPTVHGLARRAGVPARSVRAIVKRQDEEEDTGDEEDTTDDTDTTDSLALVDSEDDSSSSCILPGGDDEEDSDPEEGTGDDDDDDDDDCDDDEDDDLDTSTFCENEIAVTPSTIATGSLTGEEGCSLWAIPKTGDTCITLLNATGNALTVEGFFNANAGVNDNCANLIPGSSYCVAGPETIQFGSTDLDNGCTNYYCVVKNDDCTVVTGKLGGLTSVEELLALNPEFGPQCLNMWLGSWICAAGTETNVPVPGTGGSGGIITALPIPAPSVTATTSSSASTTTV